ncbi:MAG TPA: alpha-glucosidase [Sediminibacterium sp.]|nr:alpha-glucosidase [Sediminibacterium sp.]
MRILSVVLLLGLCINAIHAQETASARGQKAWWKEAIIYQLYPRSFQDSDGDGIGDLKGIISRLDYLQSLGITAIWLNPIYSSPNDDNGYDVSDYRTILPAFGTMADLDALLKGLHQRGIKLIMDLVVNHSSDEHPWFKLSRQSRNNPYREYYHWWNAEKGKPPYRYSLFDINHDAWRYDSLTNAYYLHYFSRKQPDLNWENPQLRREVYDIMRFWADKGIDGFRLDAFQFAAKDTTFPAFPAGYERQFTKYYAMQGNLHGYLQEMNQQVFQHYPNLMSVAEGAGNTLEDAHNLVDADRHELDIAYAFDAVDLATPQGYSVLKLKEIFTHWDSAFSQKGWLSVFLANHDQARLVSRFGNDAPAFRERSSKMLSTFLLTMRGTPFYYNGDELAMSNPGFTRIEQYQDMPTLNAYRHLLQTGGNLKKFLQTISFTCRDNSRTPFQWTANKNAGFTTGTPWIGIHPNYRQVNVAAEEQNPQSPLQYFRKLTALRKSDPVWVYGNYTLLDKNNPDTYSYLREFNGKKMLVLLNFRSHTAMVHIPQKLRQARLLLCNYPDQEDGYQLRPYEARVYSVE